MHAKPLAFFMAAMGLLLFAACSSKTRVILLPQENGAPSAVIVRSNDGGQTILSNPYQQANVKERGAVKTVQTSANAVSVDYVKLMALKPPPRAKFTLNFITGTSDLMPESIAQLPSIVDKARQLEGGEIIVVGHTDTVGVAQQNDALSRERAQAVRQLLIGKGFPPARVEAVGRGEREPVKPTADEVDEASNRRVEIEVR